MIELVVIGGAYFFLNKTTGEKTAVTTHTYDQIFQNVAAQYGLDWQVMKAIAHIESQVGTYSSVLHGILNPNDVEASKSYDGKSWGIMQFTLPTARDFDASATAEKLNNPEYSIRLAGQFIAWLGLKIPAVDPRRTEWIIKSYNQGIGNTLKERAGAGGGFANEYFNRFLAAYEKVKGGKI